MTNEKSRKRIESLDILRGIIMVLMVLDHVRDIWYKNNIDPTNIAQTTYMLFATRWITHICAPLFFILAGAAVGISIKRGKARSEVSTYLIIRGIILIMLEVTVFTRLWMNGSDIILLQVLWALGVSMIILSVLLWLDDRIVGVFGMLQILGHNLINLPNTTLGSLFHNGKSTIIINHKMVYVLYPLVPWLGVMAVGYLAGKYLFDDEKKRKRASLSIGVVCSMCFILLRFSNLFGDPIKWRTYSDIGLTIISFLNCEKYPPSLLFLLMTIGIGAIMLYGIEKYNKEKSNRIINIFGVYGRVPLFFYIVHLPLIIMLKRLSGISGVDLKGVYLIWGIVVIMLYPICIYYGKVKKSGKYKFLRYI